MENNQVAIAHLISDVLLPSTPATTSSRPSCGICWRACGRAKRKGFGGSDGIDGGSRPTTLRLFNGYRVRRQAPRVIRGRGISLRLRRDMLKVAPAG